MRTNESVHAGISLDLMVVEVGSKSFLPSNHVLFDHQIVHFELRRSPKKDNPGRGSDSESGRSDSRASMLGRRWPSIIEPSESLRDDDKERVDEAFDGLRSPNGRLNGIPRAEDTEF